MTSVTGTFKRVLFLLHILHENNCLENAASFNLVDPTFKATSDGTKTFFVSHRLLKDQGSFFHARKYFSPIYLYTATTLYHSIPLFFSCFRVTGRASSLCSISFRKLQTTTCNSLRQTRSFNNLYRFNINLDRKKTFKYVGFLNPEHLDCRICYLGGFPYPSNSVLTTYYQLVFQTRNSALTKSVHSVH